MIGPMRIDPRSPTRTATEQLSGGRTSLRRGEGKPLHECMIIMAISSQMN